MLFKLVKHFATLFVLQLFHPKYNQFYFPTTKKFMVVDLNCNLKKYKIYCKKIKLKIHTCQIDITEIETNTYFYSLSKKNRYKNLLNAK